MADPRILTESSWKTNSAKLKAKNNELQKALAEYEGLKDDDYDQLLECIAEIKKQATAYKKSKEAGANPALSKHLTEMLNAAEAEQKEIAKAKADSDKQNMTRKKAEDAAGKKKEQEEKDGDGEEESEEDEEYAGQLLTALQKLKGAKDVAYEFIVCDAKPHPCVMIAKKIGPKHKETLAKVTGSKRFLHIGTCRVEEGKYNFEMEKPAPGLARRLQASIKAHTGKKFAINVGNEVAGEDDPEIEDGRQPADPAPAGAAAAATPAGAAAAASAAQGAAGAAGPFSIKASVGQGGKNNPADVTAVQNALNTKINAGLKVEGKCDSKTIGAIQQFQKQMGMPTPDGRIDPGRGTARALAASGALPKPPPPPQPVTPPKLGKADLAKAPDVWHGMRKLVDTNIEELKKAVKAHYAHEDPGLLKEIDQNLGKLDAITDKLDHRVADALKKAHAAKEEAARKTELKNAKTILAEYIAYVKSEKLIAHVDANPWIKLDLKKTLVDHITHMAQAIG